MNIPYVFKKCSKCGEWLVANNVNFSKKKKGKYALNSLCKKCDIKRGNKYKQEHIQEIREYHKQRRNNIKNGTHIVNPAKTQEQFLQQLQLVNQDIKVLGTYKGFSVKVKIKCKICGHIWKATPGNLLKGQGCPKCYDNRRGDIFKKTHEQFIKDLQQVNPNIEVLGTYINCKTKIKYKCKIDGHEWEATPNNLLSGHGCPKCNVTKGERRVAQYLDNLDIEYIYNKGYFKDLVTEKGNKMQPDFIIPSLKIWIEYDGEQHFAPVDFSSKMSEQEVQEQFKITQQNDQIKNQYAKDNNWTLIRIPYYDYDNIEQILDAVLKQEQAI